MVMDNLPAHKVKAIEPLIEAAVAKILWMSPHSPKFNPIDYWWSQLKALLRQFAPTISEAVDAVIAMAIDLLDSTHYGTGLLTAATILNKYENRCIPLLSEWIQTLIFRGLKQRKFVKIT